MFERFTDRSRKVVLLAKEEAKRLRHPAIGTEHLLLGLVKEGNGVGANALTRLGASLEQIRQAVEKTVQPGNAAHETEELPFTQRAKHVLDLAEEEAHQFGHNFIGTEHILLGLCREREGVAAKVLASLAVDVEKVRQTVLQLLGATILAAAAAQAARQGAPKKRPAPKAPPEGKYEGAFKESSELAALAQILQRLAEQKAEAVKKQHYEDAAKYRDQARTLNESLAGVLKQWKEREGKENT